jgi:hypothetical protein
MIPDDVEFRNIKVKRVVTDEYGRKTTYGFTLERVNDVRENSYLLNCFTHPNDPKYAKSERYIRMSYDLWTDDDERVFTEREFVDADWDVRESTYHCILCGKLMLCYIHLDGGPQEMRCNHCDTTYDYHGAGNVDNAPGDSWSLTYWK